MIKSALMLQGAWRGRVARRATRVQRARAEVARLDELEAEERREREAAGIPTLAFEQARATQTRDSCAPPITRVRLSPLATPPIVLGG